MRKHRAGNALVRRTAVPASSKGPTVTVGGRKLPIRSFQEASALCDAFSGARGLGGDAYARGGHGGIHFNGRQIAHVSFNGRVWCDHCGGEIDADPNAQFPSSKGPCKCGNASVVAVAGPNERELSK